MTMLLASISCLLVLLTPTISAQQPGCVDINRYYEIHSRIWDLAENYQDDVDRSHFFGGIVRLAAHDFMDYDQDAADTMGMDGCLDWTSLSNAGLSSIWNEHSDLYRLHHQHYRDISRADFWVLAANSVILLTSVDYGLNLANTFYWGRKDRDNCVGSASRLPSTADCRQVEGVFLERMGLKWKDAVALLGAHTMGRGHSEFSGHHGTWMPNDKKAQVFDKGYYQELVGRAWSTRQASVSPPQYDFSTGNPDSNHPKMMLNTDVCLVWDIENGEQCCTRTDLYTTDDRPHCQSYHDRQCAEYSSDHPNYEASRAVRNLEQGSNEAFYEAFRLAWFKATTNGSDDLNRIVRQC